MDDRDHRNANLCDVLVDYVLDDCFQLISLLFLTVGRNNEAPAVYVSTAWSESKVNYTNCCRCGTGTLLQRLFRYA